MVTQQHPQLKFSSDRKRVLCELKCDYRVATPEELVRQAYIHHLRDHYGYSFEQMDQERKTQHGHKSPRADIVIWASPAEKSAGKTPAIVVECKSDNVTIIESDYWQGESYARAFSREEFRRLLFDCHCILRDVHKMEPGRAFDGISKSA